jgi:hypothetical protein
MWVGSCDSVHEAKLKIAGLGLTETGSYAIWDGTTNTFLVPFPPAKATSERCAQPQGFAVRVEAAIRGFAISFFTVFRVALSRAALRLVRFTLPAWC